MPDQVPPNPIVPGVPNPVFLPPPGVGAPNAPVPPVPVGGAPNPPAPGNPPPKSVLAAAGAAVLIVISLAVFFFSLWLILKIAPACNPTGSNAPGSNTMALPLLVIGAFAGLFAAVGVIAVAYQWVNLANPREALGLPQGSVRALIALLVLIMFAVLSFYLVETLKTMPLSETAAATDTSGTGNQNKGGGTAPTVTNPAVTPTGAILLANAVVPASNEMLIAAPGSAQPNQGGGGADKPKTNPVAVNAAVDIAKQILTILSTLMTAIASFYFGAKTSSDSAKKTSDSINTALGKQTSP